MCARYLWEEFQAMSDRVSSIDEFKQYFERFGEVMDCILPLKSRSLKTNKGYGFITYKTSKQARSVINSKQAYILRGKWVSS